MRGLDMFLLNRIEAADTLFFNYFTAKVGLDISCESSAYETIHMKYQTLFSLDIQKESKCRLLFLPL